MGPSTHGAVITASAYGSRYRFPSTIDTMSTNVEDKASPPSPSPFDHPDTDIIIRSADGGEFRMFKIDLTRASPVFKDLLSIPQPPPTTNPEDYKYGLPVVPLSEPSDVLKVLLQWCMPGSRPTPSLDNVVALAMAGRKYECGILVEECRVPLLRAAVQNPVRIYALACILGFEDIVRRAALLCLRLPMSQIADTPCHELDIISAHAFRRLIKYRILCSNTVLQYVTDWATMGAGHCIWENYCTKCTPALVYRTDRHGTARGIHQWWDKYLSKVVKDLESSAWEEVLRVEDATRIFIQALPRPGCPQHSYSGMADALSGFIQKVRTDLAARIQSVRAILNSLYLI